MRGFFLVLLTAFGLTGCISQIDKGEVAWQALHAADAMQTVSIATRQCYHEADPVTRRIIGKHPNEASILAWWAGTAWLHAWVSDQLKPSHPKLYKVWQAFSIGRTSYTIYQNHKVGLGPFAREKC